MLIKITLDLVENMHFVGKDSNGFETHFDSNKGEQGASGLEMAPTPQHIVLQALAACSAMDIAGILRKRRKTITAFTVNIEGEKPDVHPPVFTDAKIHYILTSPDAEEADLTKAIDLSQSTYCGISEMFKRSRCNVTWDWQIIRP